MKKKNTLRKGDKVSLKDSSLAGVVVAKPRHRRTAVMPIGWTRRRPVYLDAAYLRLVSPDGSVAAKSPFQHTAP